MPARIRKQLIGVGVPTFAKSEGGKGPISVGILIIFGIIAIAALALAIYATVNVNKSTKSRKASRKTKAMVRNVVNDLPKEKIEETKVPVPVDVNTTATPSKTDSNKADANDDFKENTQPVDGGAFDQQFQLWQPEDTVEDVKPQTEFKLTNQQKKIKDSVIKASSLTPEMAANERQPSRQVGMSLDMVYQEMRPLPKKRISSQQIPFNGSQHQETLRTTN